MAAKKSSKKTAGKKTSTSRKSGSAKRLAEVTPRLTAEKRKELRAFVLDRSTELQKGNVVACFKVGAKLGRVGLPDKELVEFGKEVGFGRSKLKLWTRLAGTFKTVEAVTAVVEKRKANGQPLNLTQIEALAAIEKKADRDALAAEAREKNWDSDTLLRKVKAKLGKKRNTSPKSEATVLAARLARIEKVLSLDVEALTAKVAKLKPEEFTDKLRSAYVAIAKSASEISGHGNKLNEAANAGLKLQPRPEAGAEPVLPPGAEIHELPSAKGSNR